MTKKQSHQKSHQIRVWVAAGPLKHGSGQLRRLKLWTAASLLGAAAVVVSGSWFALRLILNPAAMGGLSWLLPWNGVPLQPPLTFEAIATDLAKSGYQPGPPLYLSASTELSPNPGVRDWLLPVLEPQRSCGVVGPCQPIVELRVYRPLAKQPPDRQTYELIDRLKIVGPEEWAVLAPLAKVNAAPQGSTRSLPLTVLRLMDGDAPLPGVWLQLSGEWQQGSRIYYGQLLRYDPMHRRLQLVHSWTSPVGYPHWQQVTGTPAAELVIQQTLGLEPHFEVLQIQAPRGGIRSLEVEAIRLTQPALDHPVYTQALRLARHGLWSPALQQLQTLKSQLPGQWSTAAQAQLDLIALHADVTRTQAERDWASPTQQILAQIIDGRWTVALSLLKTAHRSGYDVQNLLSTNADRFWQRIEAALQVNPRQSDLQQWGALVLAVRQNRQHAIDWWQRQPMSSGPKPSIHTLLALLDPFDAMPPMAKSPAAPPAAVSVVAEETAAVMQPVTPVAAPVARIIGTAEVLSEITADWQTPNTAPLSLPAGHRWYGIEVLEFHDGEQWRQSLDLGDATGAALWQALGLGNAQLQLISGAGTTQPQTLEATIKAVQLQSGRLWLLAAASPLPSTDQTPLLALTSATVPWLYSTALTLTDVAQQNSNWASLVSPVWRELQSAQLVMAAGAKSLPTLEQVSHWTLQPLDLVADPSPEIIWTIPQSGRLATEAHVNSFLTVITSNQGAVLYSSLWDEAQSSVIGVVARHGDSPALILATAAGYRINHWSSQDQRFH
ncbi:MAG: hypothetical protein IGS38_13235 [Synechococcales cyanobacterium M58_A2018_015]|nr:hypothetical protein [Synechococcales cyanobacterium M58_A2018_015]